MTIVEEESDGIAQETIAGRVHFNVGRDQGSWQRKIAAAVMKTDDSEGSLLVAFVPQGIAASYDQGGWQREIAASSIFGAVVLFSFVYNLVGFKG
ncbi:hypothetical protein BHE74_00027510 [Ensete ventricosum]|nr:hypothetical protein BHE74_00027510 [Ensete ventricosum]RZR88602.1 hypothetical protein BHM03_00016198 [Ensete ventricosum]